VAATQPSVPSSTSDAASSSTATPANTSAAIAAPILPLKVLSKLLNILTILLRVALWPLFKVINTILFPVKEYDGIYNGVNADRAARAFVTVMRSHISSVRPATTAESEQYVEPNCPFVERGYNATMATITNRENPPLVLIYLHSPLHRRGVQFIRDYLCYGPLLVLLNSNTGSNDQEGNVICFGSSIHSADGQRLREMLDVTSFPFMALLNVKSSGSNRNNNSLEMELLLRLEGEQILTIPPQQITTYLSTSFSRHAEIVAQALAARLAREEEIRLRQEQDREYQEALLADQIREIERREEAERLAREEEEKLELERLAGEKEERRMGRARELMSRCEEPTSGPGTARIRFTLPNGKKIDRRFNSGETVEVLRAFLMVYFVDEGVEIKNIGLSTNFPRKTFGENDDGLTLEEAGLSPQAVVMVQDLDA
jgi:FAS-associated factor 2